MPDSLGHINADFTRANASVSILLQMRKDMPMTAITHTHTHWDTISFLQCGLFFPMFFKEAFPLGVCVCVCVFPLFSSVDNRIAVWQTQNASLSAQGHFNCINLFWQLHNSKRKVRGGGSVPHFHCVCLLDIRLLCHFSAMITLGTGVASGCNQSLPSLPCPPISPKPYFLSWGPCFF